jgi:hypothetical protein
MNKHAIALSCLVISTILLIALPSQKNVPPLVRVTFTIDSIEFVDARGSIVESLVLKRTVLSEAKVTAPAQACLAKPKGARTLAYAYIDGYLVSAEGQTWGSPSVPMQNEAEKTEGATVSTSGTFVSGSAVAYSCEDRQEPHSDRQLKSILIREPPRYLPPKRQSRLFV